MNLLILEDDETQQLFIHSIVMEYFPQITVFKAFTYEEAWEMCQQNKIHFFLLDIKLNEDCCHTGVTFAKKLREYSDYRHSPILFITSVPGPGMEVLNSTHCYSYLLKPYKTEELVSSLSSLMDYPAIHCDYIEIKNKNGIYSRINKKEVVYVEAYGHDLIIHTPKKSFTTRDYTLVNFCKITSPELIQIHKSYAVNPQYIVSIDYKKNKIILKNTEELIPVGRAYKKDLKP